MSLQEQRQLLHYLLDNASPTDAPTAYYALFHDPARTVLTVARDETGKPLGFAGRFQTGQDLFRPLVTMRVPNPEIGADLLAELLVPGRPYIFFANFNQLPMLGANFQVVEERWLHIFSLRPDLFRPSINVMVTEAHTPDDLPRFVVEVGGLQAQAGVNWQSPKFAEIFVHTEAPARQRGWGKATASALTEHLLKNGRIPLYLVERNNQHSLELARALGYQDTGARQLYAQVIYRGHPAEHVVPLEARTDARADAHEDDHQRL